MRPTAGIGVPLHARSNPPPTILCFVGTSGSGKTSLLERVVPALCARGTRVAYLKASAHRIDIDREGKDTDRLRRAGAAPIAIEGAGGIVHLPLPPPAAGEPSAPRREHRPFCSVRDPDSDRWRVADHAARVQLWNLRGLFRDAGVVLVEGLKPGPYPKVLVNRNDNPRGDIEPGTMDAVELHLQWRSFPRDWDGEVARVLDLIDRLDRAPARLAAADVTACVLAGGRSRRMGQDKARLPWPPAAPSGAIRGDSGRGSARGLSSERRSHGEPVVLGVTWLERACLLAGGRCADLWVIGRTVRPGGPDLPSLRWPVSSHLDLRPAAGPLGGLETALTLAGGSAVLTLPCDLPDLTAALLDRLLEARDPSSPAVLYRLPNNIADPTLALVESEALAPLQAYLDAGEREASAFFQKIHARQIQLDAGDLPALFNRNRPEEIGGIAPGRAETT